MIGDLPKPEQKKPVLSFEEFSRRYATPNDPAPRYNNFFFYFNKGEGGRRFREKEHYKKFANEHPDIATSLCEKIGNQRDEKHGASQSLKPFDRDLYEAYKIMRTYGVEDKDLFS